MQDGRKRIKDSKSSDLNVKNRDVRIVNVDNNGNNNDNNSISNNNSSNNSNNNDGSNIFEHVWRRLVERARFQLRHLEKITLHFLHLFQVAHFFQEEEQTKRNYRKQMKEKNKSFKQKNVNKT